jgi:hypothetical protein
MKPDEQKHHEDIYKTFCEAKFVDIREDQKEDHKMINAMHSVINNGLVDKVSELEKSTKWILRLLVTTMLAIVAQVLISTLM